jgi:hypothetical protein
MCYPTSDSICKAVLHDGFGRVGKIQAFTAMRQPMQVRG